MQTSIVAFVEADAAEISAYRATVDRMQELEVEPSRQYQLDSLTRTMQICLEVMSATQQEFSASEFALEALAQG